MAVNETAIMAPPLGMGFGSMAEYAAIISTILLINTLILWGLSKAFKLKRNSFVTAILASLTVGVVNVLIGMIPNPLSALWNNVLGLVSAFIINTIAIKLFYKLKIKSAMILGATMTLAAMAASMILGIAVLIAVNLAYGAA